MMGASMRRFAAVGLAAGLLVGQMSAQGAAKPVEPGMSVPAGDPGAMDAVPANIKFDVVSFRRCPPDQRGNSSVDSPANGDYLAYHCMPVSSLIYFAYLGALKVFSFQPGFPAWMDEDRYEFTAKVAPEDIRAWQKLDLPGRRVLLRGVLANVVKLKISIDQTPQSVYLLTVAKGGPKLTLDKASEPAPPPDPRMRAPLTFQWYARGPQFKKATMGNLVELLSGHLNHIVQDRTGLTDTYSFTIPLTLDHGIDPSTRMGDDGPSLNEGLAALGLRLDIAKVPNDRLLVEHIERPAEN
jgi:uncharacterized protein (TIGR03435 family)